MQAGRGGAAAQHQHGPALYLAQGAVLCWTTDMAEQHRILGKGRVSAPYDQGVLR